MARAGAARVFFDIVGTFQANKLISDTQSAATVQQAIFADAAANIADSFDEMASAILEAVEEVTQAFFDYESQLIRVRKFYQGSQEEIDTFAAAARNLGVQFGFTAEQALASSARTAQLKNVLGSQLAIIEATRAGLLLAAVGEMETEMGMTRLINLAQQTHFMMGNLTKAQYDLLGAEQQANLVRGNTLKVLDQLNTVENTSVAVMEDITFVLNQFASQAHIAGESIGEMAAMSALLLETGEEVSRAGTGLRMIYQRIGNENTTAVKVLAELMDGVDKTGVTMMKLTDIIKTIGPAYAEMTSVQKRNLAVAVAGSRHYIKFLKLMENADRLAELQTDAYRGTYDAITEFKNRTESAVFSMEQLQAMTQNMRVDIGENLAGAYITAEEATYHLLHAVFKLTETKYGGRVIGNLVRMAGVYQNLVAPIANVGFQVFNMIIAFKTLRAVQVMMSMEAVNQKNAYLELAAAAKFLHDVVQGESLLTNVTVAESKTAMNSWRQELDWVTIAQGRMNESLSFLTSRTDLFTERVKIMDYQMAEAAKYGGQFQTQFDSTGKVISYTAAQLQNYRNILTQLDNSIAIIGPKQQALSDDVLLLQGRYNQSGKALRTYDALQKEGLGALIARVKAVKEMVAARQQEYALMNQEQAILVPLNASEIKQGEIKVRNNNRMIHEMNIKAGLIRSDILRAKIKGEIVLPADIKDMETLEAKIKLLEKETLELERGIMTSKQSALAVKKKTMADRADNMNMKQKIVTYYHLTKANFTLAGAIQKTQGALMPLTMIIPFVTESGESMKWMMAGMAAMMLLKIIPTNEAGNMSLSRTVILQGMVTAGATLVAAGLAMVAGYLLVDALVGEKFLASPLDNLNEFNDGLITMESNLAGIMGSTAPVLAGVVEANMNDLKFSTDLMNTAILDIDKEISRIDSALSGTKEGGALQASLLAQRDAATSAKQDITDVLDAKLQLADVDRKIASGQYGGGTVSGFYAKDYVLESGYGEGAELSGSITGKFQWGEYYESEKSYRLRYMTENGKWIEEVFDSKDDANERFLELDGKYGEESLKAQKYYLDQMFYQEEQYQSDTSGLMREANEESIGEMFKFANAREELFFGQRQNFTGTLYKQVAQGGIENLLHKTEIIQTNVFNGMTLPEMVKQIADGVMEEMNNRGIKA